MNLAALYVQRAGAYFGLPDVDPWDEERDARRYAGPFPVVAHPPCNRWSTLAFLNQAQHGYKVGDDGGCFASALHAVRSYGGVLEHPAYSHAWPTYNLPRPIPGAGWTQSLFDLGWVCEVAQSAYGHPATKRTWLYYVGNRAPFDLDWRVLDGVLAVGDFGARTSVGKGRLQGRVASATPAAFREALVQLGRWSV